MNLSTTQQQKRKNTDVRSKVALPKKKQKISVSDHDSPSSSNPSPITWEYNPVDSEWQQDRASSLGLTIKNSRYVIFKEPRTVLDSEPPKHYYPTVGDGNCFFRALSLYFTRNEESHKTLRALIIDHMEHSKDQLSKY